MRRDIAILLNSIAKKSSNLIGNFTSNLAESWMHMRTKFDGGKMYNHCNRGSWHTRYYGAALRNNLGPLWSPKVWESSTQSTSGHYFQKLYNTREKNININNTSKSKPEIKQNRWKRKNESVQRGNIAHSQKTYGKECIQAENDILPQQLETIKEKFYTTEIDITPSEIKKIELETTSQSISTNWSEQRKKRLTPSKFGRIVKRNSKLPVAKLLFSLLYCTFSGNKSTRFGLSQERITILEYIQYMLKKHISIKIEQCGLINNPINKFLAASPDGIVLENNNRTGIIEIKNVLHNKPISLAEATKSVSNFCLEFNHHKELQLKENHNFYYQSQVY
ncbi:unnamed protein product [Mytilus coruscus]|uniref:YqaJ viral recombinase domain-containing protein n=1 Tax=Mytilus coruscus TaxID=42192 RepID=A0A6J8BXW4_MYTCO|nr:unnamed protein product [Mytilus coruscus]